MITKRGDIWNWEKSEGRENLFEVDRVVRNIGDGKLIIFMYEQSKTSSYPYELKVLKKWAWKLNNEEVALQKLKQ